MMILKVSKWDATFRTFTPMGYHPLGSASWRQRLKVFWGLQSNSLNLSRAIWPLLCCLLLLPAFPVNKAWRGWTPGLILAESFAEGRGCWSQIISYEALPESLCKRVGCWLLALWARRMGDSQQWGIHLASSSDIWNLFWSNFCSWSQDAGHPGPLGGSARGIDFIFWRSGRIS